MLLNKLREAGRSLTSFWRMIPASRQRGFRIAAGAAGIVMGLNLIRGIAFRSPSRRSEDMFYDRNPVLVAYENRRGSHLSGQALQDRNGRLFLG